MKRKKSDRPKGDWLEYQQLAAGIYAQLEPYATVTHDDHIRGHDTKIDRQIDASIRTNIAGHEILIIVQARDRQRRVDVNAVGEFASVVKDVGAASLAARDESRLAAHTRPVVTEV